MEGARVSAGVVECDIAAAGHGCCCRQGQGKGCQGTRHLTWHIHGRCASECGRGGGCTAISSTAADLLAEWCWIIGAPLKGARV
eukprot:scaffold14643_cov22-Tisochrysis_lutea.AAC.1